MSRHFNRSTIVLFFVWALIVPPGMVYTYLNYFPQEINWLYLIIFILFGILTVYFPIIINGHFIFLAMWVTLPAFLMYGLFIEMFIMQVSIIGTLFALPSRLPPVFRFFTNSLLFFILSIAGAAAFHLVGGEVGSFEFWSLGLAVLCYQATHTILNNIFLKYYRAFLKLGSPNFSTGQLLDNAVVFGILPFLLTLYYLLEIIGVGAFLLLGIPYFFLTFIVRLYNNTKKINDDLQRAGDIGYAFTNELTEEDVIKQFVSNVSEMFEADYFYMFDHKDGWLELIQSYERGEFVDITFNPLSPGQGIAGSVLLNNEPIIYSKREDWEGLSKDYTPEGMQSILCLPITRNRKIEGVLLLSSVRKDAFKDYQLKILDILCSYFTVSIEKARYIQETVRQSKRCSLTKLYNYRYLEERMESEMDLVNNGQLNELSILMLDIDHFKQVNDTYGHQSGNDVLIEIAKIFEEMLPVGGIVGRYGGEEFVYLLPGTSKVEALRFAEILRLKVEDFTFRVIPDLGEDRSRTDINITISVGVSSAPEDTDEAKTMLRNADRSLYIGAKQAGRNRVAGYVK